MAKEKLTTEEKIRKLEAKIAKLNDEIQKAKIRLNALKAETYDKEHKK